MRATHTLTVERRERMGSRYSKRARAAGKLPCVLYGQEREPAHLLLDAKEAIRFFESGERVFTISTGDAEQTVLLKDLQFDYLGTDVIHCDLIRVDLSQEVEQNVPLHLEGEAKGSKVAGAVLVQKITEVPVKCAVSAIPEELTLDISELDAGGSIALGAVGLPEGVELNGDPESVAVIINVVAEEEVEGEGASVEAEAEPELVGGEEGESGADDESDSGEEKS